MSMFKDRWKKLSKSKKYREEFVAAQVKRGIPFQIRTLMKALKLTQEELALRANLSQGVVSRAADLNNGNLTLNTVIRVAAGFDLAFVGKFVPFSELDKWFTDLSEESVRVKTFTEENEEIEAKEATALAAKAASVGGLQAPNPDWAGSYNALNQAVMGQLSQYKGYFETPIGSGTNALNALVGAPTLPPPVSEETPEGPIGLVDNSQEAATVSTPLNPKPPVKAHWYVPEYKEAA